MIKEERTIRTVKITKNDDPLKRVCHKNNVNCKNNATTHCYGCQVYNGMGEHNRYTQE